MAGCSVGSTCVLASIIIGAGAGSENDTDASPSNSRALTSPTSSFDFLMRSM
jgi:hypothetical protein